MRVTLLFLLILLCGAASAQEVAPPTAPSEVRVPRASADKHSSVSPIAIEDIENSSAGKHPAIIHAPTQTSELHPATDLYSIVVGAHRVVQTVMAGLALATFVALVIFIHKTVEFALAFRTLNRTTRSLSAIQDLTGATTMLAGQNGPAADMARTAAEELALTQADPVLYPGTHERIRLSLARIEAGAVRQLRTGTGILASISATAPFVGLFGTVFGILNSFLAIAETKTTNLAVVAPGIAEALLATAIGLAAAIPAVLIYNLCARRIALFRHRLADVATMIETLQSRALDRLVAG